MSTSRRSRRSKRVQPIPESDVLWGVGDEIARYLRVTPREAYGLVPALEKAGALKRHGHRKVSSSARARSLHRN
jgi:hypothetical protein